MVAGRGFPECLDAAENEGGLQSGLKDIAHALSLHGLHIAVRDKGADSPAHGVSGAVIGRNELMLRRQQLLEFVFPGLYFCL